MWDSAGNRNGFRGKINDNRRKSARRIAWGTRPHDGCVHTAGFLKRGRSLEPHANTAWQEQSARYAYGGSAQYAEDRKSVVQGKSVSGRVDLGGRRCIKNKLT